jgi:hypothetical protein
MNTHSRLPLVVNFFAGPGAGKSTTAAAVFAALKWSGVVCELVCEYAKDKVWEEQMGILNNQYYVFGKQLQRQLRLLEKVDVVVTDAPILLSVIYNKNVPAFNSVVHEEFLRFNNLNYFVTRAKPYVQVGRYQDEEGAHAVDSDVRQLLDHYSVIHEVIPGSIESVQKIVNQVVETLGSIKAA